MIQRAFRYRLYPTAEQASLMEQTAGAARFIYNLALEQRRDFWRQAKAQGVVLNWMSQNLQLKDLRRECDWLAAVSSTALSYALIDLDRAFTNFFRGRSGYPSFRKKSGRSSFRQKGSEISFEGEGRNIRIRIPKVGFVKLRLTREWKGRIVVATFSKDALGWHVALACEIEHEAQPSALPTVGIDRGVANTIALSTGELLSTPAIAQIERRKRKAQRILSRRKLGSTRYKKQRRRVAALAAKMARVRSHWQHEATTGIAERFGAVAIEDLNTRSMMRANRGLARSIAEQGWHGIETKLSYKLEERGGTLIKINPAYTSQECPQCGVIDKANRESQARFACRHCDFAGHADIVAATNILRRSTPVVEGSAYAPVEARTDHALVASGC